MQDQATILSVDISLKMMNLNHLWVQLEAAEEEASQDPERQAVTIEEASTAATSFLDLTNSIRIP